MRIEITLRSLPEAPPVRGPPAIRLSVHACVACGRMTTSPWFCADCRDRAGPHTDDDPYDDIGGGD